MRKKCFLTFLLICFSLLLTGIAEGATGFYVDNGKLYDVYNNPFVIRGVSHAHTWYPSKTGAFADIKKAGANAVRVVLSSGDHGEGWIRNDAADVTNIINLCKSNKLIPILECHDTTGYGEKEGAVSLAKAVAYWISIKGVLAGQENYVMINIGNEPYGNTSYLNWIGETIDAIKDMRAAGFEHTLIVDAPNWGQDWSETMLSNARQIYDADTTGNLILSIHMYGVYKNDTTVNNYLTTILNQGLPLIIGEFGNNHSDGDPDEDAIMFRAVQYNIGYFAWSWCGNGGGVEYLDMINNWDASSLSPWGDRVINGANGLKAKSYECSVFNNGLPLPPPPVPDPTPPPPSAGSCVNIPVWTAEAIYSLSGTKVQHNSFVYRNRWYSQGQNPEQYSGENKVWEFIGMCDDVVLLPTPTPTATPGGASKGDVNSSGTVDIIDALMIAQYYVGLNPTGFIITNGDIDCDGIITIVDALKVAQFYVGLLSSLNC